MNKNVCKATLVFSCVSIINLGKNVHYVLDVFKEDSDPV